jgi:hypothetical protein
MGVKHGLTLRNITGRGRLKTKHRLQYSDLRGMRRSRTGQHRKINFINCATGEQTTEDEMGGSA